MGYPFYQLVLPAIMHDNPGCTKEELAQLTLDSNMFLGEIPIYTLPDAIWRRELREVKKENPKLEDGFIYKENPYRKRTKKEKRAFISARNLNKWDNSNHYSFREGNKADNFHSGLYGLGELLDVGCSLLNYKLIFRYGPNFLKSRKVKVEFNDLEGGHVFFPDIENLSRDPRFLPEKMFDFSEREGTFHDLNRAADIFRWFQKDGRYYFDFERMKNSIDVYSVEQSFNRYCEPCSYTDFVVTLEAVRRGAWKMLSYRGLQHRENFFKRYPESAQVYGRALWDTFTSFEAKRNGMNNFELMRMRLLESKGTKIT